MMRSKEFYEESISRLQKMIKSLCCVTDLNRLILEVKILRVNQTPSNTGRNLYIPATGKSVETIAGQKGERLQSIQL